MDSGSILAFGVIVLGVLGALVVLYLVIERVGRALFGGTPLTDADAGLRILRERLRRGEITFAEYEIARHALGAGPRRLD